MFGKGDPGYKVAIQVCCWMRTFTFEDPETLPGGSEYGGVLTSASGLGDLLLERLKNADIHFK